MYSPNQTAPNQSNKNKNSAAQGIKLKYRNNEKTPPLPYHITRSTDDRWRYKHRKKRRLKYHAGGCFLSRARVVGIALVLFMSITTYQARALLVPILLPRSETAQLLATTELGDPYIERITKNPPRAACHRNKLQKRIILTITPASNPHESSPSTPPQYPDSNPASALTYPSHPPSSQPAAAPGSAAAAQAAALAAVAAAEGAVGPAAAARLGAWGIAAAAAGLAWCALAGFGAAGRGGGRRSVRGRRCRRRCRRRWGASSLRGGSSCSTCLYVCVYVYVYVCVYVYSCKDVTTEPK